MTGAVGFEDTPMLASGAWNLVMAGLWLVLGLGILVTDPPDLRFRFAGVSISSGWAALILAAYNAVRWWSLRSAMMRRRAAEEMERHRPPRRAPGEPEPERNPDFIFDEPPPEKPV
jgi:hypothetical protein